VKNIHPSIYLLEMLTIRLTGSKISVLNIKTITSTRRPRHQLSKHRQHQHSNHQCSSSTVLIWQLCNHYANEVIKKCTQCEAFSIFKSCFESTHKTKSQILKIRSKISGNYF